MLSLLLVTSLALAAEPVEATVLGLDGVRAYADLGRADGVAKGQTVLVYETIEVVDPVSGRALTDRFPLGELRVVEAGETLSLLQGDPALMMRVEVGDAILLEAPRLSPVVRPQPTPARPEPSAPSAATTQVVVQVPEDLEALSLAFDRSAGASLDDRLVIWSGWRATYPSSPMVEAVDAELLWLQEELAAPSGPVVVAAPEPLLEPLVLEAVAPSQAYSGAPLEVVLTAKQPDRVEAALLHYKRGDEQAFRVVEMRRSGDAAWVAEIPDEVVAPPGVGWFVAVQEREGEELFAGGTPKRPTQTPIELPVDYTPTRAERSQVKLFYEYVDFYQLEGVDRFQRFEADFLYRVNATLHSVRVGYGVYNGLSAPTRIIDDAYEANTPAVARDALQEVGFNFGYTELELRFVDWFSVIGRGVVGVENSGLTAGVQGRVRLGREEGTNLLLGAARVGTIGDEYLIQLNWDTVPRLPMGAGVHVTNQPGISPDDYGVRLIYEARYELTDWVEIGGRFGWQFRNIFHSGPSFGAGAVFSW